MMLRSLLFLGLGLPQPAPVATASSGSASVAPRAQALVAAHDGREKVARDFADWRADQLTREMGEEALQRIDELVAKAEALVDAASQDAENTALLKAVYVAQFLQYERRGGALELRELFLRRLSSVHRAGSPRALAAAAVVTHERLESLVRQPLEALGALEGSSTDLGPARRSGPRADMLRAAVAEAIEAGDGDFVLQLGESAAEPLADLALGVTGERLRGDRLDPLALLASISPGRALDAALFHVSKGDLLLKLRVVDAFHEVNPLASPEVWQREGSDQWLMQSEWAGVVAALYEAPGVPLERADPFLLDLIERGAAGADSLRPLVPGCLVRGYRDLKAVTPAASEAADELLKSSSAAYQIAGATLKLRAAEHAPLWGLVNSANPELRGLVARSFGPLGPATSTERAPEINAAYRGALQAFVRQELRATSGSEERLSPSLTTALVQASVTASERGRPALGADVLTEVLASDRLLTGAFDGSLLHIQTLAPIDRTAVVRAAAMALVKRSSLPEWVAAAKGAQRLLAIAQETRSTEALLDVLDAEADAALWAKFVETSRSESGLTRFNPGLKSLAASQQKRIIRALWRTGYDNFGWLDDEEWSLDADGWLELVGDGSLPGEARAWAIKALCDQRQAPASEGAAIALAEAVAVIGESPASAREMQQVGIDPVEYLQHLLGVDGAPDSAILSVWVPLDEEALVERVIQRFPPSTWREHSDQPLLSAVIAALVRKEDPALNETLLAANLPRTAVQSYLIRALLSQRFAGHLPVGGAILKAGMTKQELAIQYVSSFATEEAARLIVSAMETAPTASYRAALLAALQDMNARREAAAPWERPSSLDEKRAEAVGRLVRLLESDSSSMAQRVEAIRGLGLLNALEEIPRLIGLLEAPGEEIQKAARAALDRLAGAPR